MHSYHEEPEITTRRPAGTFTKNLAHPTPKKISAAPTSPFTKELAPPPKKDAGFAEGYGAVSDSELSALLAADEEFNASLDLARIISGNERDRCERNNLLFLGSKTNRLL